MSTIAVLAALLLISGTAAFAQGVTPVFPSPGPFRLVQGYIVPKQPGKIFHKARQNFLDREYKIAAEDIRKGAKLLHLEAARAEKQGDTSIRETAADLEKLASKIEAGTVETSRELDEAFARAHHALALRYVHIASESWAKKDAAMAGRYLKAAIYHFIYGLAWSGTKLESASQEAIKSSRRIAKKMAEGAGFTTEDAGRALEAMSGLIETNNKH